MNFLLRFLPADKRAMIVLGQRIVSSLDTATERKQALDYGAEMLKDGKVSVGELSRFRKKLGILTGRH